MSRKFCIHAPAAPPAVGPYSHAVEAHGLVFCSGQLALAPDGSGPRHGTVAEEARLALDNMRAVLDGAGLTPSDVVKVTVFLTDMGRFAEFNAVYQEYFPETPPARSCIAVAALPLGMQVEVEAVAARPGVGG